MKKNIIITGANGNLGTAAVQKFLDLDYKVIAVARSGSELGFAEGNSNFELHDVDLASEADATTFVAEAASLYGKIDAGVLLAGGFAMGSIEDTGAEALQKMYRLNFETAYYTARRLFLQMQQQGYGRIVLVGAKPALEPKEATSKVAYSLSKSLLFELAHILNASAGKKDIVTSVIVPSILDTPPNRESMPEADFTHWVPTSEVADLLAFICSDSAHSLRESVYKLYNKS